MFLADAKMFYGCIVLLFVLVNSDILYCATDVGFIKEGNTVKEAIKNLGSSGTLLELLRD